MKVRTTKHMKKLIRNLDLDIDTEKKADEAILNELLEAQEKSNKQLSDGDRPNVLRILLWSKAGYLAASFLVIASFVISYVLYGKNTDLRDELELARQNIFPTLTNDLVTINFYLKEHQDTIARQAALNSAASQSVEMQINQDDILYYELFGNQSEFMNPGMIIRGSSSQQEIDSSETPSISNGHTLTLSEARDTTDFDLVAPLWLRFSHRLDQIRKIEDHDTIQLLYTNGIKSISLFEQPLDGQQVLSHQDFREYAVYNNQGEGRGTILAWRDDSLSYVLIGNIEISQLMDMAQSISAGK